MTPMRNEMCIPLTPNSTATGFLANRSSGSHLHLLFLLAKNPVAVELGVKGIMMVTQGNSKERVPDIGTGTQRERRKIKIVEREGET